MRSFRSSLKETDRKNADIDLGRKELLAILGDDRMQQIFVPGSACEFEELGRGVKRKILAHGDALMQVEVHFKQGAQGASHSHIHTQTSYVLEGAFAFAIDGQKSIVRRGDTVYMPSGVEHGCVCLEAGVLLDVFAPQREDFLK